jgi:hypothetical protein
MVVNDVGKQFTVLETVKRRFRIFKGRIYYSEIKEFIDLSSELLIENQLSLSPVVPREAPIRNHEELIDDRENNSDSLFLIDAIQGNIQDTVAESIRSLNEAL